MSEGKGRGIFATDDIESGELILIEKPFYSKKEKVPYKENEMIKDSHIVELNGMLNKSKIDIIRTDHLLETSNKDFCDISVYRHGVYSRHKLRDQNQFVVRADKASRLLKSKSFEHYDEPTRDYYFGVYLVSPFFNNSCAPSANLEQHKIHDDYEINVFQTKRFVKKGEELFISYLPCGLKTYEERQKSYLTFKFTCKCDYCLYELDTHYLEKIKNCETQIYDKIKNKKLDETIFLMEKMNELMLSIDKIFFNSREMGLIMIPILMKCSTEFGKNVTFAVVENKFWEIWLTSKDYGSYFYQNIKYYLMLVNKVRFEKFLPLAIKNCSPFVRNIIDEKTMEKLKARKNNIFF